MKHDTSNIDQAAVAVPSRPPDAAPPALLFEMMRSFVTLAKTLNLSHAIIELNSTRQTLRRHIALLEELRGGALFEVIDRRYSLSPLGKAILPEAQNIVDLSTAWLNGEAEQIGGLQVLRNERPDGGFFYQQQHPVDRAFSSSGDMLRSVIAGWSQAQGQLEHDALRAVRPLCNIFRRAHGSLIFTEVGALSSFVSWFGRDLAQSTIARPISQMPGGDGFGRLVDMAYGEVECTHSIRLDHVHASIPKAGEDELVPISYERLILGARFPDQSPAIISVVRRTYDIEIKGVSEEMIRKMPEDCLM